jgi:two-component system, chemotaxis family, response regulator Rcp1
MRKVEILVVEDNPADLLWLESVLSEIGLHYSCSLASDGAQALDFLLKRGSWLNAPTPDLIFLDMHLPKLDGVDILRQVPNARELPICVLTSSEHEREVFDQEFGIKEGNYLIKPVSVKTIRECSRVKRHIRAA